MTTPQTGLFTSAAWYYARYRPGYPEQFLCHVVTRFGLDGTGRLLDLGCGPGQLLLTFAPYVAEAIGMDPEAEMLVEGAAQAAAKSIRNVRWVQGSDRDLDRLRDELGTFRLVTMGRSFHWMDRPATLRSLDALLDLGGGIVTVGENERIWGTSGVWQEAVRGVIQRWLGTTRRAGSGTYVQCEERWEDVFAPAGFARVESYARSFQRAVTTDEIVGYLYSTSYCSPALLGDHREAFEADMRRTLAALASDGHFTEDVGLGASLVWRR